MTDKTTIIIVGILLIVGLLGELLNHYDNTVFYTITSTAYGIGRLWGIILLIQQGSLIRTRPFFQLILFFFCILIIGTLFKLQHWIYKDIIVFTGILGIPTIYMIWFVRKRNKRRLDILKALWVASSLFWIISSTEHWSYKQEFLRLESVLFILMFIEFSYQFFQTNKQTT